MFKHILLPTDGSPLSLRAAKANRCDLVSIASHGRRLNALLIGSETNKVLRHCMVPVLVFR